MTTYNLTLSNGIATIAVDTTNTGNNGVSSLSIPGKSMYGFGKFHTENAIHTLENFASDTAPPTPLIGQIWYDTSGTPTMKYYDTNSTWAIIGGGAAALLTLTDVTPTPPLNGQILKWDIATSKAIWETPEIPTRLSITELEFSSASVVLSGTNYAKATHVNSSTSKFADGNLTTDGTWYAPNGNITNQHLGKTLASSFIVDEFKIYMTDEIPRVNKPKTFYLEGTNTPISNQVDWDTAQWKRASNIFVENGWTDNTTESKTFTPIPLLGHKSWRIWILENNGANTIAFNELEFLLDGDVTAAGGTLYTNGNFIPPTIEVNDAFDNDFSTEYESNPGFAINITIGKTFASIHDIRGFRFSSTQGKAAHAPKIFRLEYTDDTITTQAQYFNANWTISSGIFTETGWDNAIVDQKTYYIGALAPFSYTSWRLYVLDCVDSTAPALSNLSDVNSTPPTDNQILTWDSATSKAIWEPLCDDGGVTLSELEFLTSTVPNTTGTWYAKETSGTTSVSKLHDSDISRNGSWYAPPGGFTNQYVGKVLSSAVAFDEFRISLNFNFVDYRKPRRFLAQYSDDIITNQAEFDNATWFTISEEFNETGWSNAVDDIKTYSAQPAPIATTSTVPGTAPLFNDDIALVKDSTNNMLDVLANDILPQLVPLKTGHRTAVLTNGSSTVALPEVAGTNWTKVNIPSYTYQAGISPTKPAAVVFTNANQGIFTNIVAITSSSDDWSVSIAMKIDVYAQREIVNCYSSPNDAHFTLRLNASGKIIFDYSNRSDLNGFTSTQRLYVQTVSAIPLNTWVVISATRFNGAQKIFIDGVEASIVTVVDTIGAGFVKSTGTSINISNRALYPYAATAAGMVFSEMQFIKEGMTVDDAASWNVYVRDTVLNQISITQQPSHGVATVNAANELIYTPTNGFSGTDTLQYDVDASGSPADVTIFVNAPLSHVAWRLYLIDTSAVSGTSIADLLDVDQTAPLDNQILSWDTATSKAVWEDSSIFGLSDVVPATPSNQQILAWDTAQNKAIFTTTTAEVVVPPTPNLPYTLNAGATPGQSGNIVGTGINEDWVLWHQFPVNPPTPQNLDVLLVTQGGHVALSPNSAPNTTVPVVTGDLMIYNQFGFPIWQIWTPPPVVRKFEDLDDMFIDPNGAQPSTGDVIRWDAANSRGTWQKDYSNISLHLARNMTNGFILDDAHNVLHINNTTTITLPSNNLQDYYNAPREIKFYVVPGSANPGTFLTWPSNILWANKVPFTSELKTATTTVDYGNGLTRDFDNMTVMFTIRSGTSSIFGGTAEWLISWEVFGT
jgi:hypothetical protein